jgi:hypothetical protein
LADVERLVPKVIELQDDRIILAAISARMLGEVPDEELGPLTSECLLACPRLVDVSLPVGDVVLVVIRRPARPAEIVPLSTRLAAPVEVLERLPLAASSAPTNTFIRHEHTFAARPDGKGRSAQ